MGYVFMFECNGPIDRQSQKLLPYTLKIFTQNKFNQKTTIEAMFIHRNTLNYRKQRIEKICKLNFDDPNLLSLHCEENYC